jgi:hypothetical protein
MWCGLPRPVFPRALSVGGALVNVFFDVDYTILGLDGSLRPGTLEVFEQLVASGHDVYVWSGVGIRWDEVRRAGLEPFVKGVYRKPLTDFQAGLELCGVPVVPDFVIDDYPQIVAFFGGVCIKEYFWRDDEDAEIYAVLARVAAHRVPAPDPSLAED